MFPVLNVIWIWRTKNLSNLYHNGECVRVYVRASVCMCVTKDGDDYDDEDDDANDVNAEDKDNDDYMMMMTMRMMI